jgi:CheY-like chemotaxis protein
MGDAARLQQVVGNLLGNAVKFARPGGRVDVRLSAETRAVRIEVADDGVGIHPDFLPHVFDRFAQADSSITRTHGGLGLGLAIVRHIVELHGGAVFAPSPGPGGGATFSVVLPAREGTAPDRPAGRLAPVRLDGLTILLADDDADTRETVATMLEDLGARIVATRSADEALAALDAAAPDLLLSDIGMPERDGFALLRSVRARSGPVAALPAVALTAYAGLDDRQRVLDAGFAAHVPKPVDPAALSVVIARVAGRR